jgi:hypothetical protein
MFLVGTDMSNGILVICGLVGGTCGWFGFVMWGRVSCVKGLRMMGLSRQK